MLFTASLDSMKNESSDAVKSIRHSNGGIKALEGLRVDVDDRGDACPPHRGRGGSEELSGPRRKRAGLIGLGDELRSVAAAEAEQRRGPEQIGAGELSVQLAEQAGRRLGVGAGGDDRDQMAEGRVAELTPSRKLLAEEAGDVVARGVPNGVASGWNVCTITFPGASRPLRPASCVTSWKVRSSARKSGSARPVSASTTAASETPGK